MSRMLLTSLLCLVFVGRASAQSMLDLFPQDAALSISIRDLDDLMKKGDVFLKQSEIRVPFRPSELFNVANNMLGTKQGLNRKGSAAIVLLRPEKQKGGVNFEQLQELLVPIVPFTDAEVMAGNFGIPKGTFVPKAIKPIGMNILGNEPFAMRQREHVYLSGSKRSLERMQTSRSIAGDFTPAQQKQLNSSDMLLHFGRYFWELESNNLTRRLVEKIKPSNDPQEIEFADKLVKSLDDIQHAVIGARIGDGLGFHFAAAVPKDSDAAKLFKTLRGERPSSTLKGLPEGNLLLAQAFSTDERQHALLAKGMFNFILEDLLIEQKIIAPADRLNYLDLFHEVWRKLEGSRLAVYQTPDGPNLGLFSVVAILDTKDAPQYLRDLKGLMKMAEAASLDFTRKEVKEEIDIERFVKDLGSNIYAIRLSAATKLALIGEPALPYLDRMLSPKNLDLETTRRVQHLRERIQTTAAERRKGILATKESPLFLRPTLTFVPDAERRSGIAVDVVHIKLAGLEKVPDHQYRQLLGRDWDKMRLAVVGQQVVVLLGSDLALFESAIKNVQDRRPGLADSKALSEFHKTSSKDRLFEFHVSIEGLVGLVGPNAPPRGRERALTSIGLSMASESLHLDAWLPMPEVRAIARKAQE